MVAEALFEMAHGINFAAAPSSGRQRSPPSQRPNRAAGFNADDDPEYSPNAYRRQGRGGRGGLGTGGGRGGGRGGGGRGSSARKGARETRQPPSRHVITVTRHPEGHHAGGPGAYMRRGPMAHYDGGESDDADMYEAEAHHHAQHHLAGRRGSKPHSPHGDGGGAGRDIDGLAGSVLGHGHPHGLPHHGGYHLPGPAAHLASHLAPFLRPPGVPSGAGGGAGWPNPAMGFPPGAGHALTPFLPALRGAWPAGGLPPALAGLEALFPANLRELAGLPPAAMAALAGAGVAGTAAAAAHAAPPAPAPALPREGKFKGGATHVHIASMIAQSQRNEAALAAWQNENTAAAAAATAAGAAADGKRGGDASSLPEAPASDAAEPAPSASTPPAEAAASGTPRAGDAQATAGVQSHGAATPPPHAAPSAAADAAAQRTPSGAVAAAPSLQAPAPAPSPREADVAAAAAPAPAGPAGYAPPGSANAAAVAAAAAQLPAAALAQLHKSLAPQLLAAQNGLGLPPGLPAAAAAAAAAAMLPPGPQRLGLVPANLQALASLQGAVRAPHLGLLANGVVGLPGGGPPFAFPPGLPMGLPPQQITHLAQLIQQGQGALGGAGPLGGIPTLRPELFAAAAAAAQRNGSLNGFPDAALAQEMIKMANAKHQMEQHVENGKHVKAPQ